MLGARAAQAFGVPFCLSTMSICSIEDVRSAVQKPFWFQVYLMRDRSFNVELLDRALAANCSAIMLTVDMPVQGLRRRDSEERPVHSAAAHAQEHVRGRDAAHLGAQGAHRAGAAPSAISRRA